MTSLVMAWIDAEALLSLFLWVLVWLMPLLILGAITCTILVLPLQRQERARFFLDLLERHWRKGDSVEKAIVSVAATRDLSLPVRLHLLAAYLEQGVPLKDALANVPNLLPDRLNQMLKVGLSCGVLKETLQAGRQMLRDGWSSNRHIMHYIILLWVVCLPLNLVVILFLLFGNSVLEQFLSILNDMNVDPGPWLAWVAGHRVLLANGVLTFLTVIVTGVVVHLAGSRLQRWMRRVGFPLGDWLVMRLPWKRMRLQRDFAAMLASLLDAGVPEYDAIREAAHAMGNSVFKRRARQVLLLLEEGVTLKEAIARLDLEGEFRWRMETAGEGGMSFYSALKGWMETMDARAFRQEQTVAQSVSTGLVVLNGLLVLLMVGGLFEGIGRLILSVALW